MRSERGQGTVEYVAVVLLVALVMAGVAAAATGTRPEQIASAVRRQIVRALCIVTGGDCYQDLEACTTSTTSRTAGVSLKVAVLRLGRHHFLIRDERSDGTIAFTLAADKEGGFEIAAGTKVDVRVNGTRLAAGGQVAAAALARASNGRRWVVRKGPEADALEDKVTKAFDWSAVRDLAPAAVERRLLPTLPPPSSTFSDRGLEVSAGASVDRGALSAELGVSAEDVAGTQSDLETGRTTFVVKRRNELTGRLGGRELAVSGSTDRTVEYTVTVGRDGRPVDFAVVESGSYGGSYDLPPRLQVVAGLLGAADGAGRAWAAETHLDLSEPSNLAVARAAIAQIRDPQPRLGDVVAVSDDLERALDERGVIHARTFATTTGGFDVDVASGAGLKRAGVEAGSSKERNELLTAATRGVDGEWRARDDCTAPRA